MFIHGINMRFGRESSKGKRRGENSKLQHPSSRKH
jgi:hypothetical protein